MSGQAIVDGLVTDLDLLDLLSGMPDCVVVTDGSGTVRWINDQVTEVLGFALDDVLGTSVFDVAHPAQQHDAVQSFMTSATSPGSYPPIEMLIRDVRGDYHYFDVRARTLQRGTEPLIVFAARATHERDALQRRHRLYFEEAPAALGSVVSGERGVDANGPMAQLFGYTREEMLSIDGTELVHPEDREAARRDVAALQANGQPRVEVVRRFVRADGSTFFGRAVITTIRTPDGAIDRLLFAIADVTSELEARELLARSEARFRALVDHSPDIVAIIRADGDWEASQQGTRLLGYPKGFDPPGGALSLVHPDDAERAGEALAAIFAGRRSPGEPLELRLRAADGTYREFECIGQNLDGEPNVSGVVITARDITQRRAAERALGQA
ncbi:MAG TPA: PAS domain-containing protein, partial [Acidimicrobiia bacterium]